MPKQKAARNRTIDFSVEEGEAYLNKCIREDSCRTITEMTDAIILGDTFSTLKKLPEKSADLLIADPPYNLDKDYNGNRFHRTKDEQYIDFTKKWISLVKPLLKSTASVYVCCDWRTSLLIGPVMMQEFNVLNRITWQREKGRGAAANWKNGMEDIWFASVSGNYRFDLDAVKIRRKVIAPYRENGRPKDWDETADGKFRDTCPSNFWDDISIPYWSMKENTAHPAQKPEKLLAKLILASSQEGDMVLDPFAGSGSTAVTAKKLNRHFCAIEQNPLYCAWSEYRLEMADNDKEIQGYADGVFWERNSFSEAHRHS